MAQTLSILLILSLLTSCQPLEPTENSIFKRGNPAIIGGAPAADKEFPFLFSIWLNSSEELYDGPLCGGTLIHKRWVLTAAHCMVRETSETTQGPLKVSELALYLGSVKISGVGARVLLAKSIHIHPKFEWPNNDVALIELAEEITDVTPVLLSEKDLGDSQTPQTAISAGWGLTDHAGGNVPDVLQKVTLSLIDRKTCSADSFVKERGWVIKSDTLCTSTANDEQATCPGDSGGPLLQFNNGQYTQIGIVSWGFACHGPFLKGNSNAEGFASVAAAYKWITSIMHR